MRGLRVQSVLDGGVAAELQGPLGGDGEGAAGDQGGGHGAGAQLAKAEGAEAWNAERGGGGGLFGDVRDHEVRDAAACGLGQSGRFRFRADLFNQFVGDVHWLDASSKATNLS